MNTNYIDIEHDDGVAILWLDEPGSAVNKLSRAALEAFTEALDRLERDAAVRAAVLISRKPDSFVAGADLDMIREMTSPAEAQALVREAHGLLERVRQLRVPTVAAVHGPAMGGGLEITLVCTYRIATAHPRTRLALPEVRLGLLPGAGGTQHLPRLVGIQQALEMMLTGKNVYPRQARKMGLVDALVPPALLLHAAREAAHRLAAGTLKPGRRKLRLNRRLLEGTALTRRLIYEKAAERVQKETKGNYPAPRRIIDAVKQGMEEGLEEGLAAEARHFGELVCTPQSRALVSLFFAKQKADKNPLKEQARPVQHLGVLGAGLMGAGIAEISVREGFDVLLKDEDLARAAHGKQHVWQQMNRSVKKGALSPFERDVIVERVVPVADYAPLAQAELVIEAVPEDLDLKRRVLADTEAATREDCIFASNTSSIPIATLAETAKRPHAVIGMHYFSPVPKIPLLEIIRTEHTPDWVLATAYAVGLKQGKTVIVVRDGPGFYTTRILALYLNEALLILQEGAAVEQVDEAMEQFGFPMGPFELLDLVGLDVAVKITEVLRSRFADRPLEWTTPPDALMEARYWGRKRGSGFYRYEGDAGRGRVKKEGVNEKIYTFFGGSERVPVVQEEVQERLALVMVNEAVRCLEEGILESPVDGDLGAVFGLGFPPFRGGPFRYVDQEGVQTVVMRLQRLQHKHGPRFTPADLLLAHAREQQSFYPDTAPSKSEV